MPRKDLLLVGLIVAVLAVMVVPLSSALIDTLIAINISLAVLLLMVAVYLKHPSDFSTFPSVILIGTAFRLALSIGTTRLILSEADGGQIIETFGDFVVSGSVAIGLVIFLIITVVQFLVVTKGAERVAEVGARFALDALPGKQMSIDADVRAGNIEQEEASALRKRLDKDSQFFGAMDGAMKFVKGDAIAGLIIIIINLVGGIAVGVSIHKLSFGEAVGVYSLLTIGDGLVAQIPALIMSLCAGVVVTRAANGENDDLGTDIFEELIADPRVPAVAAVVVLGMGTIPGFPFMTFAISSATLMVASLGLRRAYAAQEAHAAEEAAEEAAAAPNEENADEPRPASTRLVCKIGLDLARRVEIANIETQMRRYFTGLDERIGVAFPAADMQVDDLLDPNGMVIELDEVPVHTRIIPSDVIMVAGGAEIGSMLRASEDEVIFADWVDQDIRWVPARYASEVEVLKLPILDLNEKTAELIFRVYEQNLGTLFSKIEFDALMAAAEKIDEEGMKAVEQSMTRPGIFHMMRYLVEDGVPLRPLRLFVDALVYWARANEGGGPVLVAECLRGSMKRQLCHNIAGRENILGVAMIDPDLENLARNGLSDAKLTGSLQSLDGLVFDAETTDKLVGQFRRIQQVQTENASQIAIVAASDLRRRFRNFMAANRIHLPVLAPHELSPDVKTYPVELITLGAMADRGDPQFDMPQEDTFEEDLARAEAIYAGQEPISAASL